MRIFIEMITGDNIMRWYTNLYEEFIKDSNKNPKTQDEIRKLGTDIVKLISTKYLETSNPEAFARLLIAASYNKEHAKSKREEDYFVRSANRFIADMGLILSSTKEAHN